MRVLFDASVLVPAFVSGHEAHAAARGWVERALTGNIQGLVAARTFADTYDGLVAVRTLPRLRTRQVLHLIDENLRDFEVVVLRPAEHRRALARAAELGLPTVRDALVAEAALRSGADALLTLAPERFARLGDDVGAIARGP